MSEVRWSSNDGNSRNDSQEWWIDNPNYAISRQAEVVRDPQFHIYRWRAGNPRPVGDDVNKHIAGPFDTLDEAKITYLILRAAGWP